MLTIEAVANGFILTSSTPIEGIDGTEANKTVIEIDEDIQVEAESDTKATQKLLYAIMEYYGLVGSKHDKMRVRVVIEKKDVDY